MLLMTIALTRRSDMTRAAFSAHWRDRHAPLVKELAPILGIRRYVQIHSFSDEECRRASLPAKAAGPYDGLAEVWFDSVADALERGRSGEAQAARDRLRADELCFLQREATLTWWGRAYTVL
jgi:uncharacterized protein (TIGR02118 family)